MHAIHLLWPKTAELTRIHWWRVWHPAGRCNRGWNGVLVVAGGRARFVAAQTCSAEGASHHLPQRKLQKWEQRTWNNSTPTTKYRSRKAIFIMLQGSRLRPFFENVRVQIWRCRICASAWSALLKESAILHKARAAEPYSFLLINVIQASLSLAVLLLCFSLRIMNPPFKQLF